MPNSVGGKEGSGISRERANFRVKGAEIAIVLGTERASDYRLNGSDRILPGSLVETLKTRSTDNLMIIWRLILIFLSVIIFRSNFMNFYTIIFISWWIRNFIYNFIVMLKRITNVNLFKICIWQLFIIKLLLYKRIY